MQLCRSMRFWFPLFCLIVAPALSAAEHPNVVLIYADDLGYGDLSCYGARAVQTPAMDRIAHEGIRFTDAHSSSATCTPSRYSMLTGRYAFRKPGSGVAPGDAPLIIDPHRKTLADVLHDAGYHTGVVGKWHLGLGPKGGPDWNGVIKPGPLELGFDYCYLIPATGDRVPCVFVEKHRVDGLDPNDPITVSFSKRIGDEPIGAEHPELLKMHPSHGHDRTIINGISRIGYMSGGKSARWVDENIADVLTTKALNFIANAGDKPFFLYFAYHDIHVPRVPHPRFVGRTGMGPRGDAIDQMDWCTGQILAALDRRGLTDNTLVIFTSDNGPVVDDGYKDDAVEKLDGHSPAGPLRGGKYSNFEGGTRVPLMVRWPAKIKPGQTNPALVCQVDLLHSLAALTGQSLNDDDAPDSINVLPALLGNSDQGRDHLIEHARSLSLRAGSWKYIEPNNGAAVNRSTNTELGNSPTGFLFNLDDDLAERTNLIKQNPDMAKHLAEQLQKLRAAGRSR